MATTTSTEPGKGAPARGDAGFDLDLSPEQEMVQHTAREFAHDRVLPLAHEIDERKEVPAALIASWGCTS